MAALGSALTMEGVPTSGGFSSRCLRRNSCRHLCRVSPAGSCEDWESHSPLSWRNASRTQYLRNNAKKILPLWAAVGKGQPTGWGSFLVNLWEEQNDFPSSSFLEQSPDFLWTSHSENSWQPSGVSSYAGTTLQRRL